MARVLVIGDTHCPGMHPGYISFLQRIKRKHKCTKVIHIGDLVDNAAISYHEKSPSLSSAEEEFFQARMQVAKIHQAFPKATLILGNHDALSQRQATTAGIPEAFLRPYGEVWGLRGWTVYPRFSRYVYDGVIYAHGDAGKGGMYSAVKNSRDNFQNWVQGHSHSEAGVWYTQVENHRIFGMNVGCGLDADLLQFNYGKKFNKKPVLGCGVVIDGKHAIFEPM